MRIGIPIPIPIPYRRPFISPHGLSVNNILWYIAPAIGGNLHSPPLDGKLTSASGQISSRWLPAGIEAGKQLSHQWTEPELQPALPLA